MMNRFLLFTFKHCYVTREPCSRLTLQANVLELPFNTTDSLCQLMNVYLNKNLNSVCSSYKAKFGVGYTTFT